MPADSELTLSPATVWFVEAGEPVFNVTKFSVNEPMSSMFEVVVTASSPDATFDPGSFVGKGAAFRFAHHVGDIIRAGICSKATLVSTQPDGATTSTLYEFVISPALWRTTLRRNNRIFQQMTVPEIVSKVLDEWKIPHKKDLKEPHLKQEYRVQYGETDYAFISRLLQEEGISFTFDHAIRDGKGSAVTSLILADQPQLNPSLGKFRYLETGRHKTFEDGANIVFDVNITHRMTFGKATIRDFDHRLLPHMKLVQEAKGEGAADKELVYEDYQYVPGAFRALPGAADGTPVADDKGAVRTLDQQRELRTKREIESARRGKTTIRFKTSALEWAPGDVVEIGVGTELHPSPHVKGKKLLIVSRHFAGTLQGIEHQDVEVVPADVPHRPARNTPKPRIVGLQSAIVVGPQSQEIHTDELGRVRVRFHWDREHAFDDKSSCWMRVSQASAGSSFGFITIPRVGHEVLVGFYDGDPDRPVVVGRLFNKTSGVPYELAKHKTRSGWRSESSGGDGRSRSSRGYNELMFEDAIGHELVSLRAERNLNTLVKGSENRDVGAGRTTHIGQTDMTNVGKFSQVLVGEHTGLQMSEVGVPYVLLSTGGASIRLAGDNISIEAKGKLTVHAGKGVLLSSLGTIDVVGGPEVHVNCNDGAAGEVGAAPRPVPLGPAKEPGGGPPLPAPYDPRRTPAVPPPPLGFAEIQIGKEVEEPAAAEKPARSEEESAAARPAAGAAKPAPKGARPPVSAKRSATSGVPELPHAAIPQLSTVAPTAPAAAPIAVTGKSSVIDQTAVTVGPVVFTRETNPVTGAQYSTAGVVFPPSLIAVSRAKCLVTPFVGQTEADAITGWSVGGGAATPVAGPMGSVSENLSGTVACIGAQAGGAGPSAAFTVAQVGTPHFLTIEEQNKLDLKRAKEYLQPLRQQQEMDRKALEEMMPPKPPKKGP